MLTETRAFIFVLKPNYQVSTATVVRCKKNNPWLPSRLLKIHLSTVGSCFFRNREPARAAPNHRQVIVERHVGVCGKAGSKHTKAFTWASILRYKYNTGIENIMLTPSPPPPKLNPSPMHLPLLLYRIQGVRTWGPIGPPVLSCGKCSGCD